MGKGGGIGHEFGEGGRLRKLGKGEREALSGEAWFCQLRWYNQEM